MTRRAVAVAVLFVLGSIGYAVVIWQVIAHLERHQQIVESQYWER